MVVKINNKLLKFYKIVIEILIRVALNWRCVRALCFIVTLVTKVIYKYINLISGFLKIFCCFKLLVYWGIYSFFFCKLYSQLFVNLIKKDFLVIDSSNIYFFYIALSFHLQDSDGESPCFKITLIIWIFLISLVHLLKSLTGPTADNLSLRTSNLGP